MGWYLDSTRIFVTEYNPEFKQIIARLQPLSGPTVHQTFGYESRINKVTAYFVGLTDLAAMREMVEDGALHLFTTAYATSGWFYVNSVSPKLVRSVCQTLRPDLAEDSPVYIADIELYYDE